MYIHLARSRQTIKTVMQIKMLNIKMKKACTYHKTFFFKKDPIKNSHDFIINILRKFLFQSPRFNFRKENISIELFSTG